MSNASHAPVVLVIGSDYEVVKMGPIYSVLKRAGIPVYVCLLMPHTNVCNEIFTIFGMQADYSLSPSLLQSSDPLETMQSILLTMKELVNHVRPLLILLQDDTIISMAVALTAHNVSIPVAHVDAGLYADSRMQSSFDNVNRRLISLLSTYHFASTDSAVGSLLCQGVRREQIFCTGNTLVDALCIIKERIFSGHIAINQKLKECASNALSYSKRTGFLYLTKKDISQAGLVQCVDAIKHMMQVVPDVHWFVYATPLLAEEQTFIEEHSVVSDLTYSEMIYLLDSCHMVITNDERIQEQAVSLGKHVIVLDDAAHSMEGVLSGLVRVMGKSYDRLSEVVHATVTISNASHTHFHTSDDGGHAAEKIVAFIQAHLDECIAVGRSSNQHSTPYSSSPKPLAISLQEKTE